jgi:RNA polymerase sigma factor (sigma-70 family)
MEEKQDEFQRLLREIQEGSADAVQQFLDRYGRAVLQVIRRRLDRRMRSQFDSIDFLQDVWASFFRSPPPPAAFAGPETLFRYLTTMARNKVVDAFRQSLVCRKYNVNRELPREDAVSDHLAQRETRQPAPSQEGGTKELWEEATKGRTKKQVKILTMLRDGYTHAEIAQTLQLSERTVRRFVREISTRLSP